MKLLVGRVHHMDESRSRLQMERIRQALDGLALNDIDVADVIDVWFQPPFLLRRSKLLTRTFAALWEWEQEHFSMVEFRRRRGVELKLPLKKYWRIFKKGIQSACHLERSRELSRHAFVEKVVAGKHLHVWTALANSDAEGALVFEDDFQIPSTKAVGRMVEILQTHASTVDLIDLAGGYSRHELGIRDSGEADLVIEFLVANTACAYYISKKLAQAIVAAVVRDPGLIRLGVDFLIPYVNRDAGAWRTLLPDLPPMVHGSFHGGITSAIRP